MNRHSGGLRRELDAVAPDARALDRLVDRLAAEARPAPRRAGRRALAAAVCAALIVTALAAGPTLWELLREQLGPFAPYAGPVTGEAAVDQGIEVKAVSALSDGTYARIYLSIRDLEGDRLDGNLQTDLVIRAKSSKERERGSSYAFGRALLSYDPETRTALLELTGMDIDTTQAMSVEIGRMTINEHTLAGRVSLEGVGAEALACEEVGQEAILWRPGDLQGAPATDAALPEWAVALKPGQNARAVEGTEEFRVSAVGFATDGYLHLRLEWAPSLTVGLNGDGVLNASLCDTAQEYLGYTPNYVLAVEGGIDIVLPEVTAENVEQYAALHVSGSYQTPGAPIEGAWVLPVAFEVIEPVLLDWTGETDSGGTIGGVWLSPLTAVLECSGGGTFSQEQVAAHLLDGSTVTSHYANGGGWEDGAGAHHSRLRWAFDAPVELEDIAYLSYGAVEIPVR